MILAVIDIRLIIKSSNKDKTQIYNFNKEILKQKVEFKKYLQQLIRL